MLDVIRLYVLPALQAACRKAGVIDADEQMAKLFGGEGISCLLYTSNDVTDPVTNILIYHSTFTQQV